MTHRAGFVNLLGKPNAGKSTLLNVLVGEKLAITSPKVQTTRHRILGIRTESDYQMVFSDTPGIINPQYKLQEKMMGAVQTALEDADVALILMDARDEPGPLQALVAQLPIKAARILVINKCDLISSERLEAIKAAFTAKNWAAKIGISALKQQHIEALLRIVVELLPEGPPFYPEDVLTDRPVRFFVSELIREKVYSLFRDEVPYQTAVLIRQFEEKKTLTKISADIIVQRQSQKGILLGEKGRSIKEIGSRARQDIERFLERKVFLELHVKVRAKWRDKDHFLKEYGY